MVTTRSKRWNGNTDSLPVDFLNDVMAKMIEYGDRVQFSLASTGPRPSYEVINTLGKKMAFDKNHHLFQPQDDEFTGENASSVLTLDQVKERIAGGGKRSTAASRTTRAARPAGSASGRTSAAKMAEQFAAARYEYFKNNRQMLPPRIADYSNEIAELMGKGKPVEEAFNEVLKKHF